MKKPVILCVILFGILILGGCSITQVEEKDTPKEESASILPEMTFSPATLTQDEENIQALVRASRGSGAIYDYNISKDIQSIKIHVIEHKGDKVPVVINSDFSSLNFKEGRCYFEYSADTGELNVAFQSENEGLKGTSAFASTFDVGKQTSAYSSSAQMYLSSPIKIKVGEEIPITLVMENNSNEMSTFPIEKYIEEPNLLKEYDRAYLITLTFLEEDV